MTSITRSETKELSAGSESQHRGEEHAPIERTLSQPRVQHLADLRQASHPRRLPHFLQIRPFQITAIISASCTSATYGVTRPGRVLA